MDPSCRPAAMVTGTVAGQANRIQIRRNETIIRQELVRSQDGAFTLSVAAMMTANSEDVTTVHVEL
ncbi:MAG: hypothetical protein FJX25_11720 [Alphaproteobacteria bacterium]|nr:hypothetical protein [Alphaproteobacteria bacterium]